MRKFTISLISLMLVTSFAFAGGLVTNTNQSAAWARMLVRDASTSIDAVYYNPAALTKLQDGFHLSISNQSIFQTRTITNTFPYLNNDTYEGTTNAPIFPSVFAAYKTGKFAFSFGFNPIGGGGSAEFLKGIPSAEMPLADAAHSFASLGVTGYSTDLYLKGSSIYWGLQLGVSYAINDNVSIFAGGRYVMAKNTYVGHIKDNKFRLQDGSYVPAPDFMNGVSAQAEAGSGQAAAGASSATEGGDALGNWTSQGAGGYTFDQAVAGGIMTEEQKAQLEGGLLQFGYTQDQIDAMTLEQAQGTYYGTASYLTGLAEELHQQSLELAAGAILMGDQDIDVTQTGNGFTPIIGANISLMDDNLNFGIKYEFKTKMTLTNSTPAGKGFIIGLNPDGTPIEAYPDGGEVNADMPAMLSIGAKINVSKVVTFHAGFHTYWDSKTDWKNVETNIDRNFQEYALAAEFHVTDKLLLSTGFLYAATGVNDSYQSDLSYSLTTSTMALGGAYKLNDKFTIQLGGYLVNYYSQTIPGSYDGTGFMQTYAKDLWAVSLGLDFTLGK
jgi:long-subunit fatty acid transport protein